MSSLLGRASLRYLMRHPAQLVLATAAMWFIGRGDWQLASWLFVLGNVGVAGSFVFYDALLPSIARPDELDRVSTTGYALGSALVAGLYPALRMARFSPARALRGD